MNLINPEQANAAGANGSGARAARAHRLLAAQQFIDDNLQRDDLTPTMTAEALGISVRQLHMLFEPTGRSFSRYVLARRLDRARQELASDPDRAVVEIALACGIKSSTVFYRGFRHAFGMNPTDYRQSVRGNETPTVAGE
jgi:AraC-like DNA-binding protein